MTSKLSIFYLDDEASCLDVFQQTYNTDYDVRVATRVADAWRMLAESQPDIIISDQSMPEIEGTEFLRQVAEKYPDSYRVLLTGSILVGDVLPQISTGTINYFIVKPWTNEHVQQMFERANSFLERRQGINRIKS